MFSVKVTKLRWCSICYISTCCLWFPYLMYLIHFFTHLVDLVWKACVCLYVHYLGATTRLSDMIYGLQKMCTLVNLLFIFVYSFGESMSDFTLCFFSFSLTLASCTQEARLRYAPHVLPKPGKVIIVYYNIVSFCEILLLECKKGPVKIAGDFINLGPYSELNVCFRT